MFLFRSHKVGPHRGPGVCWQTGCAFVAVNVAAGVAGGSDDKGVGDAVLVDSGGFVGRGVNVGRGVLVGNGVTVNIRVMVVSIATDVSLP